MPINPHYPADLPAGPKPINDNNPENPGSVSTSTNPVAPTATTTSAGINDGFDALATTAVSNHENSVLTTETGLQPSAISLGNGSAIVNTRVLAANWKDEIPATELSGLKISGLNLQTVENGEIKISFPLRKGTFEIPTSHANAETQIEKDGLAEVRLHIGRNEDGLQIITNAGIKFDPKLTVLNPASSLQPSEGFMAPVLDWVKDVAGDVEISGLSIDTHGKIDIDGSIIQPWPLDDQDLGEHIPKGTFPKLNMGLQNISDGQLVREEATPQTGETPSLKDLLSALGALTGNGQFSVQLHTKDTSLRLNAEGLNLHSQKSPIDVDIRGKVQLDDDGNLSFQLPNNLQPEIKSGAGELDLMGHFNLRVRPNGKILGRGALRSRAKIGHIDGQSNYQDISKLPFVINSPDNVVIGKTVLNFDGDNLHIGKGRMQAKLHASLGEGAQISIDGSDIDLYGGQVFTDGNLHFFTDDKGVNVRDGVLDVQLTSKDSSLRRGSSLIKVNGSARVNVHGEELRLDAHTGSTQGRGQLRFRLTPKGFTSSDTPFWGSVNYELMPDGRLSLQPGPDGITEFTAPFSAVSGASKAIVDPATPAAGSVGSAELKAHLAKLCDSPIRSDGNASLLIDGVQSRAARLKMIRTAKKSIAMQTLIFKDDKTGSEMADELIAAAKRGVKVRLIVDAIGNLQKPSELREGKALYKRLRNNGVELALYNDPRDSGLGQLLDVVANNPEISPLNDLDSLLQDPIKALDFMQSLSRIAAGEGQASVKTRKELSEAIDKVLAEADDNPLTVNSADLSAVSQANKSNAGEILTALRLAASLNNRWHEKYLIVDGEQAITGGMNIADEYLLGGSGEKILREGVERSPWRDTDMHFEGDAARDVLVDFARNWKTVTQQNIAIPEAAESASLEENPNNNSALSTVPQMQIIQHRPRIDGDHHIVNFMIENIKALKTGQKAYISNAYFLPTGALQNYKQALIDAANRGVDVRILTNSESTTDLPQVNHAALESYLALLDAGVRIFERKGERTMHTKAAVFGGNTGTVGSWNTDNRSASLNSEHLAVVYDPKFAKQLEDMFASDSAADVAKEIHAVSVKARLIELGLKGSLSSLFAGLM